MAIPFPESFVWGAATASYQIEGGVKEGGRGESIWDRFSHAPGKVENGDTGDVAADHYHRWAEDVQLMKELGLAAYRFSIAWPRILPEGTGAVNEAGLDFYDRLVDALLAVGIEPFVTLYHWDLPQALQDRGGWPNRDVVDWFAEYTDVVSRRLGDRVRYWITHNEPFVAAILGYAGGQHAPGFTDFKAGLQAVHHLLLSHGRVVPVLRRNGCEGTQVGITLNLSWVDTASDSPADVELAHRQDAFLNRMFLDALYKGAYPQGMLESMGPMAPHIEPGDLQEISVPTDFLGINNYTRSIMAADPENPMGGKPAVPPDAELTDVGWEVYPVGLYQLLRRVHDDYAPQAIYITENGAAYADKLEGGQVHDPKRVVYLQQYLAQAQRAIEEGVPLKGYFVWSLMDNFEWAYGYAKRFGIIYVDYESQRRVLKDSALFFKQVIAANALP